MTNSIKLVGIKSLRMPNGSIEAKQKVVSLYNKGYSLFSISKATSVPKSSCWDIVRRYKSQRHVKNRKSQGRPKNLDSKEEKQLINLSQSDPKKNQLNFYGILTRKNLFHKFDTKNINLLSVACQICYEKTLSYRKNSTCQKSLGQRTRFTSQNFLAKCAVFGRNNSGTAP